MEITANILYSAAKGNSRKTSIATGARLDTRQVKRYFDAVEKSGLLVKTGKEYKISESGMIFLMEYCILLERLGVDSYCKDINEMFARKNT